MGTTLDALQALQQIELKRSALRRKIESKKRRVQVHRKRITTLERQLEELHVSCRQQQAAIDQLELEVKSRESDIARLREVLNRSKTNKEYAAILSQINTSKADNTKLEDRELKLLTELETRRAGEDQLRTEISREQQMLDNALQDSNAFEEQSRAELEALDQEREQAAEAVPPEALAIFERVAERHDGEALAMVFRSHPKKEDFICDGCNMNVTLEQYVALKGGDRIQVCHNCGRVLYLDADAF